MKYFQSLTIVILFFLNFNYLSAQDKLSPYFDLGIYKGSITDASSKVIKILEDKGFSVIGNYTPEKNENLFVLVFSSSELQNICLHSKNRSALAAALKVGFIKSGENVKLSMLNPDYLFNAYFQSNYIKNKEQLHAISEKAISALKEINNIQVAFGGNIEIEDLREYQYMWGMEEFTDPVKIKEFSSFKEGTEIIRRNLKSHLNNTTQVYELVFPEKEVAVFGVGLLDNKDGEKFFLPIIGENHICAMPYEIIIEGNKASILHGRYRIALHWPELTMGTFTKIINTPGNIEDFMEALTK